MQHILITGANRGIGLELTKLYIEGGDKVFAGARNPQKTVALEEIAKQHPERPFRVFSQPDPFSHQFLKTKIRWANKLVVPSSCWACPSTISKRDSCKTRS